MEPANLPAVLEYLAAHYPKGAVFYNTEGDGPRLVVTVDAPDGPPKVEVKRVTDLEALAELTREPKTVKIKAGPHAVEVQVRAISAKEIDEIEKLLPPVVVPRVPMEGGKKGETRFDYEDPKYKEALDLSYRQKRAVLVRAGLVDITVPGGDPAACAAFLGERLTMGVLDQLVQEIMGLTKGELERTDF